MRLRGRWGSTWSWPSWPVREATFCSECSGQHPRALTRGVTGSDAVFNCCGEMQWYPPSMPSGRLSRRPPRRKAPEAHGLLRPREAYSEKQGERAGVG